MPKPKKQLENKRTELVAEKQKKEEQAMDAKAKAARGQG